MKKSPTTLGEKLARAEPRRSDLKGRARLAKAGYFLLNFSLLSAIAGVLMWWAFVDPGMDRNTMLALLIVLVGLWLFFDRRSRKFGATRKTARYKRHPLLENDRQGFMSDLRLDQKTAVFDGSNVYHFGHDNGLDAQPLGMIAHQLRVEGYRVVCFFDANIFYTLQEHGAFPAAQDHSIRLLEDIFGLMGREIYIVPSGVQADGYILDSLKHLPISFAVTNDLYRDYAKKYPTVMKGDQWRKGIMISKNEIKLQGFRFQTPVVLN